MMFLKFVSKNFYSPINWRVRILHSSSDSPSCGNEGVGVGRLLARETLLAAAGFAANGMDTSMCRSIFVLAE